MRIIFLILFLISLTTNFLSAYAQNDLDKECKDFCKANGFKDGHYLPPDGSSTCKDGYTQHPDNQICCCKK